MGEGVDWFSYSSFFILFEKASHATISCLVCRASMHAANVFTKLSMHAGTQ